MSCSEFYEDVLLNDNECCDVCGVPPENHLLGPNRFNDFVGQFSLLQRTRIKTFLVASTIADSNELRAIVAGDSKDAIITYLHQKFPQMSMDDASALAGKLVPPTAQQQPLLQAQIEHQAQPEPPGRGLKRGLKEIYEPEGVNPYDFIRSGTLSSNFITWSDKIPLSGFESISQLFVRESYVKIYDLIMHRIDAGSRHHLVTGVPGIGKSSFSLYFLWRYLRDNRGPVLCEFNYNTILMIEPNSSSYLQRADCLVQSLRYPYLVDLNDKVEPEKGVGSFTVVFSSPDPSRYKEMMKIQTSSRYIMPVWTWDELHQLWSHTSNSLDLIQLELFPSMELLSSRFQLVGGIPRLCFKNKNFNLLETVRTRINVKGIDFLIKFLRSGFSVIDEEISHLLIHRHPDENDGYLTDSDNYAFASDEIFRMMIFAHNNALLTESLNYFNQGLGAKGGTGAGDLFQKLCLGICRIAGPYTITTFPSDNPVVEKILQVPTDDVLTDFKCESESIVIRQNYLYIPAQKNFESGDAFYLSPENELIVIQVTVGQSHPVKMNGLVKISELFADFPISNYHLVFLVPTNPQLNSRQPIITKENKVATNKPDVVKQFEMNQWRFIHNFPALTA